MSDSVPESNIDIVSFHIAYHAMVGEVSHPGTALVDLFSQMSKLAQQITLISHDAHCDWEDLLSMEAPLGELRDTVLRQMNQAGDSWTVMWALAHIAKHLYHELERVCLEHSISQQILSVKYNDDASLDSWTARPKS